MTGQKITMQNDRLNVPDNPIIPFIEGDGIGPDIWRASERVFDAAVEKAFGGKKKIVWKEVLAGEKAFNKTGEWLPQETLTSIKEHLVAIKLETKSTNNAVSPNCTGVPEVSFIE